MLLNHGESRPKIFPPTSHAGFNRTLLRTPANQSFTKSNAQAEVLLRQFHDFTKVTVELRIHLHRRRSYSVEPVPRNYVRHNADFSGKIKNPVLTMHTVIDPLVVVANGSAYAETIAAAGRNGLLFQVYTNGNGHCAFTGPQLLTAVNAIDNWVRTGVRPTDAQFPAAAGFVPGFVPPPFPQP